LDDIKTHHELPIRGLAETETGQTSWTYPGEIPRVTYAGSKEFQEAIALKKAVHLVPSATNFSAIDSIVYNPNDVLTLIQVTMNKSKHPITIKGLRLIQSWLQNVGTGLPTKNDPWRFVFVVPLGMGSAFKLQQVKDDTKNGEWAGKMKQYVSEMHVEGVYVTT